MNGTSCKKSITSFLTFMRSSSDKFTLLKQNHFAKKDLDLLLLVIVLGDKSFNSKIMQ